MMFGMGEAVKRQKVIYYSDELKDEFSTAKIKPIIIDKDYSYDGNGLRKLSHIFWYVILARPLAYIFLKLKFGHKIVNRNALKQSEGRSIFIYGNHTNAAADAFIPSMVSFPKDAYVIVHPDNVSMPVLGKVTPSLGALPLPDTCEAVRNFLSSIEGHLTKNEAVMIYPEAHIWPYYTKIRPFKDTSFRYPVQYHSPVYCFTNVYKKRRIRKTPRIVTYVDGPFLADETLSAKEQKQRLRDLVYETMCTRSAENNIEMIKYIKETKHD